MKIREASFLEWPFFNGYKNRDYYFPTAFFSGIILAIITLSMTAGPGWMNPLVVVPLALIAWVFISYTIPNLGRLHVLSGLNEGSYGYRHELKEQARKYLALSSADRALFPAGILDTIKDPNLTTEQEIRLDKSMKLVHSEIESRERLKRQVRVEASRRNIDVSDAIAAMEDSRNSVRAEASVWSDELDKIREME